MRPLPDYIFTEISSWCFYDTKEDIHIYELSNERFVSKQCILSLSDEEHGAIAPLTLPASYFTFSKMSKWLEKNKNNTTVDEALATFLEIRKRADTLLGGFQSLRVFIDHNSEDTDALYVLLLPRVDTVEMTTTHTSFVFDLIERHCIDSLYITKSTGRNLGEGNTVYMGTSCNSHEGKACDFELIPELKNYKNYKFYFKDERVLTFEDIENL